jgi:hypothetical protein
MAQLPFVDLRPDRYRARGGDVVVEAWRNQTGDDVVWEGSRLRARVRAGEWLTQHPLVGVGVWSPREFEERFAPDSG